MPRKREKTRIELLAEALEATERTGVCLAAIDLRTTSGEMRTLLRAAREHCAALSHQLAEAIRADVPPPIYRRQRSGSVSSGR